MKKIVILLVFIFLITGCRVKYNLSLNEDLTIDETAMLTGTDEFFNVYYKTTRKNVLKSFIEIYQDILTQNNYQFELKEDDIPYVLVTKKYSNVSEYAQDSILFNDYFDEVKVTEDGNIKKIETVGFHPNEPDNPDRFNVKELEIAIKCAYNVKNHNATKVDKLSNTYYYDLNENNNHILLEYDSSSNFNPNSDLIRIIIICAAIIIVLWITVIYLNKKNKRNN